MTPSKIMLNTGKPPSAEHSGSKEINSIMDDVIAQTKRGQVSILQSLVVTYGISHQKHQ